MRHVVLAVLLLTAVCFGQNSSVYLSNIIQPSGHIEGSTISYTGGVYTIPNGKWAKAAELQYGEANGYLEVHLVKDASNSWYKMPMSAGKRSPALFDKVRQTNTTVTLSKIVLFTVEPQ